MTNTKSIPSHPFLLCGILACLAAWVDAAQRPPGKALSAPGIEVDVKKREVRMDAAVCLDAGILEYLVCLEGTFEHETVFSTKCRPSQLHLALLAIGLVPHPFGPNPGRWWAANRHKPRSRVDVEVEYKQDGKTRRRRIAEFLVRRESKDGAVADHWVFTGSVFFKRDGRNRYAADYAGIVIGIIPIGSSVVQFGEQAADPYRGEAQGLEVNARTVPAVGSKVKLIFKRHEEKGKGKTPPRRTDGSPNRGR